MPPKVTTSELIAVRVLREQRWAYEARLAHLSYREMRGRVNRPESEGGLGYDLSEHALKALVKGYRDRMAEVEAVNLDEHRERELHDIDLAQRRLDAVAEIAAKHIARADEIGGLDVHGAKLVIGATRERRAHGESRRRLLGLDAPQSATLDVTVHDAVSEELNAMLAQLDPKGADVKPRE